MAAPGSKVHESVRRGLPRVAGHVDGEPALLPPRGSDLTACGGEIIGWRRAIPNLV
jgi:hypothetical protein